jgi:hypothetical protein
MRCKLAGSSFWGHIQNDDCSGRALGLGSRQQGTDIVAATAGRPADET